jgi:pseudouridine kinase
VISNVARNLARLDVPVRLLSFFGNDTDAVWLEAALRQSGVDTGMVMKVNGPTGKFSAILGPDGSLFTAACSDDSEIVLTPSVFESKADVLKEARAIVADANISVEAINWLSAFCSREGIPLFLEPVSVAKAKKLAEVDKLGVFMMTPNEDELPSISRIDPAEEEKSIRAAMGSEVEYLWLRKGALGSVLYHKNEEIYLPAPSISVKDSTGAGDAALAGFVAAWYKGKDPLTCLKWGHSMAAMVLMEAGTIAEDASISALMKLLDQYYPEA